MCNVARVAVGRTGTGSMEPRPHLGGRREVCVARLRHYPVVRAGAGGPLVGPGPVPRLAT